MKLFTLMGINVYLHESTWLFLLVITAIFTCQYGLIPLIAVPLIFTMTYGSVILHEFGHAIAAKYFGYPVGDITIYPIGGMLELKHTPYEHATAEFLIAIAGPLVNLILIALAYPFTLFDHNVAKIADIFITINYCIFVFNMTLPLMPMDGSRVLRSLLCFCKMPFNIATNIMFYITLIASPIVIYYFYQTPTIYIIIPIMILAAYAETHNAKILKTKYDFINALKISLMIGEHYDKCKGTCDGHNLISKHYVLAEMLYLSEYESKYIPIIKMFEYVEQQDKDKLNEIVKLPPVLRSLKIEEIFAEIVL